MALLVVQHLDRSHPSLLTEILAQRTPLAVEEATDGRLVEENHVYVIPPDTSMSVAHGRLVLRPRGETLGPPMPIDDMLDSLAKDQGSKAIGVILSGSGTDGAIGMQAIKGCGGIGFAQDDDSARYTSMPRAAVELGGVDRTLPPAQIAAALLRLVRNPSSTCRRSMPTTAAARTTAPTWTACSAGCTPSATSTSPTTSAAPSSGAWAVAWRSTGSSTWRPTCRSSNRTPRKRMRCATTC